jgi:hypothetical protein
MMRSKVQLKTGTYLLASSRSITSVDHWALGRITYSLENCCLPCIGSSNNEDPELDIVGDSGEILLRIHDSKMYKMKYLLGG